jgi:hypothetical protein
MMMMVMTVRKYMQAHRAAPAKLVLMLLIVTSLTVPITLSSLPLAAADEKADCEKSGGTYQVKDGNSHCFVTLEPDCYKMPAGEVVPDPELCLKPGGISNDPTPSACTTTEGGTNTATGRAPAAAGEGNQSTTEGDPVPGVPDTNSATTTPEKPAAAGEGNQSTISELRMQIEEACIALQTGDTQGAMMNMDLALNALGSIGDNGTQVANITNTTTTTASGATNATTTTTNTTTGTNATQEVDQPINSTASKMEGDPVPGNPEPPTPNPHPSAETTTEPTTTTSTDGDDIDTGGEGETGEGGSSDDVDRGDAD